MIRILSPLCVVATFVLAIASPARGEDVSVDPVDAVLARVASDNGAEHLALLLELREKGAERKRTLATCLRRARTDFAKRRCREGVRLLGSLLLAVRAPKCEADHAVTALLGDVFRLSPPPQTLSGLLGRVVTAKE